MKAVVQPARTHDANSNELSLRTSTDDANAARNKSSGGDNTGGHNIHSAGSMGVHNTRMGNHNSRSAGSDNPVPHRRRRRGPIRLYVPKRVAAQMRQGLMPQFSKTHHCIFHTLPPLMEFDGTAKAAQSYGGNVRREAVFLTERLVQAAILPLSVRFHSK